MRGALKLAAGAHRQRAANWAGLTFVVLANAMASVFRTSGWRGVAFVAGFAGAVFVLGFLSGHSYAQSLFMTAVADDEGAA